MQAARIGRVLAGKAVQVNIVGRVPLGYRIVGYPALARAQLDETVASLIQEAFRQAAKPDGSLRVVLANLVEQGAAGRRGKAITLSTLQRIMTDPFYKGMVRCDGRLIPGSHQPLVSDDLFAQVQRQLRRRRCG